MKTKIKIIGTADSPKTLRYSRGTVYVSGYAWDTYRPAIEAITNATPDPSYWDEEAGKWTVDRVTKLMEGRG